MLIKVAKPNSIKEQSILTQTISIIQRLGYKTISLHLERISFFTLAVFVLLKFNGVFLLGYR